MGGITDIKNRIEIEKERLLKYKSAGMPALLYYHLFAQHQCHILAIVA